MTDLSPATEAVLNAVTLKRYDVPHYACPNSINQIKSDVAAALRAVVDQVLPENAEPVGDEHDAARADQWLRIRLKMLAIAAELEAQ